MKCAFRRSYLARSIAVALPTLVLGGCGNQSLLDMGAKPVTLTAVPAGAAAPKWSLVSFPRLSGVPPEFALQLTREIDAKARPQAIALLVDATSPTDVVLRGSLTMTRDNQSAKIFYRWDVTVPAGKQIQRIEGSEISVVPKETKEPWVWVSPRIISLIADKAMEAMLPHLRPTNIVSATEAAPTP